MKKSIITLILVGGHLVSAAEQMTFDELRQLAKTPGKEAVSSFITGIREKRRSSLESGIISKEYLDFLFSLRNLPDQYAQTSSDEFHSTKAEIRKQLLKYTEYEKYVRVPEGVNIDDPFRIDFVNLDTLTKDGKNFETWYKDDFPNIHAQKKSNQEDSKPRIATPRTPSD